MTTDKPILLSENEEIVRRTETALLRALSTPHKKQSEMKLGKRKANQKPSASGAVSDRVGAQASRKASKP